eukprot:9599-Rhodomonas_salina.1
MRVREGASSDIIGSAAWCGVGTLCWVCTLEVGAVIGASAACCTGGIAHSASAFADKSSTVTHAPEALMGWGAPVALPLANAAPSWKSISLRGTILTWHAGCG